MSMNINDIKSALTGGGARPSLFEVQITGGQSTIGIDPKLTLTAKAASLPSSNLGNIKVPYFGRTINVAGDRTFDEWTITVINDEDWVVKAGLESWHHAINAHVGNIRHEGALSAPSSYKGVADVKQYSKEGQVIQTYKLYGLFPTVVSDIPVSWETTDAIEEFTVTFQYDHWEREGAPSSITG